MTETMKRFIRYQTLPAVFAALTALLLSACGDSGPADPETTALPPLGPAGGIATTDYRQHQTFISQLIPGLDLATAGQISQGEQLFMAHWEAAPSTRPLFDGLGPLFIADACAGCHLATGRASALNSNGSTGKGILFRLLDSDGNPDAYLGVQFQNQATSGSAEGEILWRQKPAGGIDFYLSDSSGRIEDKTRLAPRLSPQLYGVGLLALVDEAQIAAWADPHDLNKDGISGRVNWLTQGPDGALCAGRFGWKAIHCTLTRQVAGAFNQDMGLTSPLFPDENCSAGQSLCNDSPGGGNPEVSDSGLNAVDDFLSALAVPGRRITDNTVFDRGRHLFHQTGCSSCHRPALTTGDSTRYPHLSQQTFYPYTDLLLHDMGTQLADGVTEEGAGPQEWRTPPLWGLGLMEGDGQTRFLHDGRASSLEEAIIWHDGEARLSRQQYQQLDTAQQQALLAFLRAI